MFLDKQLMISDAQAVTATAASDNQIDLGAATRDIGAGEDLYLVIKVDEAVDASGSATVAFDVRESAAANMGTPTTLASVAATGKATLVAGYQVLKMKLPFNTKRYLDVNYTVATGPLTAGKFSAFIVKDSQSKKVYPGGFTIS